MELSEAQKTLIQLLKILKIQENQIIATMLALQKEHQQEELIYYIKENQDNIDNRKISKKVTELIKKEN